MLGSRESSNEPVGSINVGNFKYLSSIGFSRTALSKVKYVVVCVPHQISYCLIFNLFIPAVFTEQYVESMGQSQQTQLYCGQMAYVY
jgi:hypothetical protein